jgi:hypothetical protein
MSFKHTYRDWKEGNLLWNDIVSNEFEESYISNECKSKIDVEQKQLFNSISKNHLLILVDEFAIKNRDVISKTDSIISYLKTIENLFNGVINNFGDTKVIFQEKVPPYSYSAITKRKLIPPLSIDAFNEVDIQMIREARTKFLSSGKWNFKVIETPKINKLVNHPTYQAEVWAKTYYDFAKRLNLNNGNFRNTFNSKVHSYLLKSLRVSLHKGSFISKTTDVELFIKIFKSCYLFSDERIIWLKSLSSLNYFISELEKLGLEYPKDYDKWEVVANCFAKERDKKISKDSLRKIKKSEILLDDKKRIDGMISFIKR